MDRTKSTAKLMFNGIQENPHGNPLALFTDMKTKGTFAVLPGEDVIQRWRTQRIAFYRLKNERLQGYSKKE